MKREPTHDIDPTYAKNRSYSRHLLRKEVFVSFVILLSLVLGTIAIILYGSGYRFGFEQGQPGIEKTGLLVASSVPDGAQVLINDKLTTATDNTINLKPGEYNIKILLDGYFPWEKQVRIQEKVVTSLDALLFPIAPKLESITLSGVEDPVLDPTLGKIAFKVQAQTPERSGIYVYDMGANPVLSLSTSARQIATDEIGIFSTSQISWAPDGADVIATISGTLGPTTYLLVATNANESPLSIDSQVETIQREWGLLNQQKEKARTDSQKKAVRTVIKENFDIISYSPDDTKILYTASKSASLPYLIKPRLIGVTNTLTEERNIKEGQVYVYNIKEDVNVMLFDRVEDLCSLGKRDCRQPLTWFPDSNHLIYVEDNKIDILEYDGSNRTTVYAGPFFDNYVFSWPNESKIVILTSLNNQDIKPSLYTVGLE